MRLEQANSRKQSVLDGLKTEMSKQQKVASEIAQQNAVVSELEQALEQKIKSEGDAKHQIDQLNAAKEEVGRRSHEAMTRIEEDTKKKSAATDNLRDMISKEENSLKQHETELEAACKKHTALSKANEVPVVHSDKGWSSWDEAFGMDLLETEDKAINEEEEAKNAIDRELQELQSMLESLQSEAEALAKKASELEGAEKEARVAETKREEESSSVLERLETEKAEMTSLIAKVEDLRSLQEKQETEDKETARKLAEEIAAIEAENFDEEKAILDLDAKIREYEETREREFKSKKQRTATLLSDIRRQEEHSARMKSEADTIEESGPYEDEIEKIHGEISRLFEGKLCRPLSSQSNDLSQLLFLRSDYPLLESVVVTYDPDKSAEEQAKIDLAIIIEDCKKREESVRKLQREQQRAKEQEEKERKRIEKDLEEEAQRRERARQRRRQRHEDETKPTRKNRHEDVEKRRHRDKRERRKVEEKHESRGLGAKGEEVSAAKPRNLLDHFSQATEENQATQIDHSSSRKKVRWSEDRPAVPRNSNITNNDSLTDDTSRVNAKRNKEKTETSRSRTFGKANQRSQKTSFDAEKREALSTGSGGTKGDSRSKQNTQESKTESSRLSNGKAYANKTSTRGKVRSIRCEAAAAEAEPEPGLSSVQQRPKDPSRSSKEKEDHKRKASAVSSHSSSKPIKDQSSKEVKLHIKRSKPKDEAERKSKGDTRHDAAKEKFDDLETSRKKKNDVAVKTGAHSPDDHGKGKKPTEQISKPGDALRKSRTEGKKSSRDTDSKKISERKRMAGAIGHQKASEAAKGDFQQNRKRGRQSAGLNSTEGASKQQRRRKKTQPVVQTKPNALHSFGEDFAFDFHK